MTTLSESMGYAVDILPSQTDQDLLYSLICSQLEKDGYKKSALCLQVELGGAGEQLGHAHNKLEQLLHMCVKIKQHLDHYLHQTPESEEIQSSLKSVQDMETDDQPASCSSSTSSGHAGSPSSHVSSPMTQAQVNSSPTNPRDSPETASHVSTNAFPISSPIPNVTTFPNNALPQAPVISPIPIISQTPIISPTQLRIFPTYSTPTSYPSTLLSPSNSKTEEQMRMKLPSPMAVQQKLPSPAPMVVHPKIPSPVAVQRMIGDDVLRQQLLNFPGNAAESAAVLEYYRKLCFLGAESAFSRPTQQSVSPSGGSTGSPGELAQLSLSPEIAAAKAAKKIKDQENDSRKRYPCSYCGRRFAQQSALQVHERTHTGEKPYQCHYCDKAFTQISNLKCHERLHTGEKPYRCQLCGKRFTQSASLRCHMRSHTGERPYLCKFCNKRFTQPASLQHHIRIHTGEKPYKCDHCGKCFTQPSSLVVHRRLHTGERPFACQICGKSYTQAMPLKEHMRTHHCSDKSPLSFNIGQPFSLQMNQLQSSLSPTIPMMISNKLMSSVFPNTALPSNLLQSMFPGIPTTKTAPPYFPNDLEVSKLLYKSTKTTEGV